MMDFTPSAHQGVLHHYYRRLVAFEHAPPPSTSSSSPPTDTLIFVGGLNDGLLTVPFSAPLSQSLPPTWTLVQPLLSSSYTGWGTSSLDKDVAELSKCVAYFRKLRPHGKIIVMGHSTGCQDVMHYLVSPEAKGDDVERPRIDAAILQASVSDREAMVMFSPPGVYEESVKVAQEYVKEGRGEDVLPNTATGGFLNAPISARRWLSLASPPPDHAGQDDYFSSDLPDERLKETFGKIGKTGTPLLILYAEDDQYVPDEVDKEALVRKWESIVKQGGGMVDEGSGLVMNANHNLDDVHEEVTQDLISRVRAFAERIKGRAE